MAVVLAIGCVSPGWAQTGSFATNIAPVLQHNCTKCHGATKQKASLRLDSLEGVLRGSENGKVLKPGDTEGSELLRRVMLPPTDEDFMPSGDSPPLEPADLAALENWVAAGAPETASFELAATRRSEAVPPAAPDYRPKLAEATELARRLGVRLIPRSRVPTDGLVLRTASAPGNCNDEVLAKLASVSDVIVDAELARTKVTDKGMKEIGRWPNLIRIDLSHTVVTSDGVARLATLGRLESLNLTATKVDNRGVAVAMKLPKLRTLWSFGDP
ncbi:MAG TPA: c-type cytochrome domain-containing protein [Opitutaceae bacterium]|jgi:hypothetical protein|nr:c-type cytochrome domain-containing protein [Opitutaceae bacterium]